MSDREDLRLCTFTGIESEWVGTMYVHDSFLQNHIVSYGWERDGGGGGGRSGRGGLYVRMSSSFVGRHYAVRHFNRLEEGGLVCYGTVSVEARSGVRVGEIGEGIDGGF